MPPRLCDLKAEKFQLKYLTRDELDKIDREYYSFAHQVKQNIEFVKAPKEYF